MLSYFRSWLFPFFFLSTINVLNDLENLCFPLQTDAVQNKVQRRKKEKKASWDLHKLRTHQMLASVFVLVHMVG